MSPKSCEHQMPPSLTRALSPTVLICPICLIKHYIAEIQKIQASIHQRGGVFESKNKVPSSETPWGSKRKLSHKQWMQRWRLAKMEVYDDVKRLEGLKFKYPGMVEEWGVENALDVWKQAEQRCCRVPGYPYVGDEESESEWMAFASQPSSMESPVVNHSVPQSTKEKFSNLLGLENAGLQEMEATTRRLSLSTEHRSTDTPNDHSFKPNLSTPKPAMEAQEDTTFPTPAPSLTPRSAIKRSNSNPAPTPKPLRSITFRPLATVLSDPYTLPKQPSKPILQPHNKHTRVEKSKRSCRFYRKSPLYKASAWASPEGYEKADTSHCKTDWDVYECLQQAFDDEQILSMDPRDEEGATEEKSSIQVDQTSTQVDQTIANVDGDVAGIVETKPSNQASKFRASDQKPSAPTENSVVYVHDGEQTAQQTGTPCTHCETINRVGEREGEQ